MGAYILCRQGVSAHQASSHHQVSAAINAATCRQALKSYALMSDFSHSCTIGAVYEDNIAPTSVAEVLPYDGKFSNGTISVSFEKHTTCAKIRTFEYLLSTHVLKLNMNEGEVLEMAIHRLLKKPSP